MKVILTTDVDKLGRAGDLLEVKDGYARNYLIPKKLAITATTKNITQLEYQKKLIQARENKRRKNAHALKEQIEKLSITIPCKAGESERLFGSVTAIDIAQALKKENIEIDKRWIKLDEPLKTLGVYNIPIHLEQDITAILKVWLVKE
jgi:large subunit ribosomal protein L9